MSECSFTNNSSFNTTTMPSPFVGHVINVKLMQENYLLWTAQTLSYLKSQGLAGFVDGSNPAPRQTIAVEPTEENGGHRLVVNLEYTAWYPPDQLVLSIINSSITEDVLATTVGASTTRATWVTLERMFASTSMVWAMQIRMELTTIQKKDLSIADYFCKVKQLGDTLAAIGKRLDDEELIAYMRQGLG
jgi:hypothetical protein